MQRGLSCSARMFARALPLWQGGGQTLPDWDSPGYERVNSWGLTILHIIIKNFHMIIELQQTVMRISNMVSYTLYLCLF